jgi:hypothetical protein
MRLDQFTKAIEAIQKQYNKETRLTDALQEFFDGHFVPTMSSDATEALIEVLEIHFDDAFHTISWWLFENDFGTKGLIITIDGNEIPMVTVEDLYNYLNLDI